MPSSGGDGLKTAIMDILRSHIRAVPVGHRDDEDGEPVVEIHGSEPATDAILAHLRTLFTPSA